MFMPHILLTTFCLLMSYVDGIVLLYVVKNIFSLKEVATNHKSTIHLLFICTWPLLFYSSTNTTTTTTAFYSFLCAYPVVLNLLVSLIMCYIILSYVADYCCIRLWNGYGAFYTLVVGNCCWLIDLARRWIGV